MQPVLNLTLTVAPISLFKWQLYLSQSVRSRWMSGLLGGNITADLLGMGEESDEDADTLKRALVETSPYLLGITVVVSLLHSVFEFLAFKNGSHRTARPSACLPSMILLSSHLVALFSRCSEID